MDDDSSRRILQKLKAIEQRLTLLEADQHRLQEAYGNSRVYLRRLLLRPPMWTFEQHPPRRLDLHSLPALLPLPAHVPSIAVVTPSFNHERFLRATIDSVLAQAYPKLSYHVQDGASQDGTQGILKSYGDRISWRSEPDDGQSDAINRGFAGVQSDIMAYLNSDDTMLPGTLAYIANFFAARPDVDIVYAHRIFIDRDGAEIGRAVLPAHDAKAIRYADYIPQETMFWRRRVWDKIGGLDSSLQYAMDWDFILAAQTAGFKLERARTFLACFRVHDAQKTTKNYDVGRNEMQTLRLKYLGYTPTQADLLRGLWPYLVRQFVFHWGYMLGLLKR